MAVWDNPVVEIVPSFCAGAAANIAKLVDVEYVSSTQWYKALTCP
jgi:hypothetical protein